MATNKDILLKDKNNNNLYPLAHQDYNQHILDEFYFGTNGVLPTNTDLNDISKTGSYWLSSGNLYAHTPFDDGLISGNYGTLLIYKGNYSSDKVLIQEFIKIGGSKFYVYYRYKNSNGVWQSWLQSGGSGEVTDIQVNGTTILSSGIANFYINSAAGQYGSGNKIATMADIGAAGGGTVTNIAVVNTGGLTITGSPISTAGTISIGHLNNITSQTTIGLYPITIDKYGHITSYSNAVTIPTVNNASLSFYKDSSVVNTFTANASADKSITFATANINSTTVTSKAFVDSITWTDGTKPTRATKTVVIGGSTTSIPTITAKSVVSSVTFNNVITGGSTTAFKPVTKKTVVTGGSTTSIYTPAAKSVVTSATATSASYSSGILYITNGSFTTGNSIDFSSEAVNVYTSLTTGDSVIEGDELSVYTSLTSGTAGSATLADSINIDTSNTTTVYTSLNTSSIYEITGVGTMPTLSYTTSNINLYVTTTSVTVLSNVS